MRLIFMSLGLAALLLLPACSGDSVVSGDLQTLISGTIQNPAGDPIEGAQISIRYEPSDTSSSFLPAPPPGGRWFSATGLDSLDAFFARQMGFAAELRWSVDTLGVIDSFLVERSLPQADSFAVLTRVTATPPDTAYALVDSLPAVAGTYRYRLSAEIPGGGLAGDPKETRLRVGSQLRVPYPNPMVDTLSLGVVFFAPTNYRTEVQSTEGDLLRLLGEGAALPGDQLMFGWNGEDSLGQRPAGGIYRIHVDLVPEEGDPTQLITSLFLNEGRDALADSSGTYTIEHVETGAALRVVSSDGTVVGPRVILQTVELTASAPGYVAATEALTVVARVNNKLSFELEAE